MRDRGAYVWHISQRTKDGAPKNTYKKGYIQYPNQTEEEVLERLRSNLPEGPWRIYRSADVRDTNAAKVELAKKLLDNLSDDVFNVEAAWTSSLMSPKCRFTKLVMMDVDTKDPYVVAEVEKEILKVSGREALEVRPSKNGWHYLVSRADWRGMGDIPDVEVKYNCSILIDWSGKDD